MLGYMVVEADSPVQHPLIMQHRRRAAYLALVSYVLM